MAMRQTMQEGRRGWTLSVAVVCGNGVGGEPAVAIRPRRLPCRRPDDFTV
jgi:hypothetical protein